MSKKSSLVANRAWKTVRLSLVWAKKGGLFRNRVEFSLNLLHKGIRNLRHSNDRKHGALVYGEHELSFDDTPVIHVKMHRPSSLRFKLPHIPCIRPEVDFDYDFEFDDDHIVANEDDRKCCEFDNRSYWKCTEEETNEDFDEAIDLKAEEFIAKFHEQMKLQRQISLLQYSHRAQ